MIDEVEKVVIGPVQVLEDEHRRSLLRQRLEEVPPRGEAFGAVAVFDLSGEADQGPKALGVASASLNVLTTDWREGKVPRWA